MIDAREVLEALRRFKDKELPQRTEEQMEQVCLFIEAESKKLCPAADTGNLRASITHDVVEEEGKIVGYVGSNLDYAPYVHQGTGIYALEGKGRKEVPWTYYDERTGEYKKTKGMEPRPFIQDAIDAHREEIVNYFQGVLDGDIGTSN